MGRNVPDWLLLVTKIFNLHNWKAWNMTAAEMFFCWDNYWKRLAGFFLIFICCLPNEYFSRSKIPKWAALPFLMVKSTKLPVLSKKDAMNHTNRKGSLGSPSCPRHLRGKCLKPEAANPTSVSLNRVHLLDNITAISRHGGTRLWPFSASQGMTGICSPDLLYLDQTWQTKL